jgi:putative hemolysin
VDAPRQIVGEICDDTDRDVQAVHREPGGALLLSGTFPIHDLPDVGNGIPTPDDGDFTTVAGLVLSRLGHIPTKAGENVDIGTHTAEVVEVTGRAITKVRLRARRRSGRRSAGQADASAREQDARRGSGRPGES